MTEQPSSIQPQETQVLTLLRSMQKVAKLIEQEQSRLAKRKPPAANRAERDAEERRGMKQEIDRGMHELHCLAVELGIAKPEPSRYGEKRVAMGFGRFALELRREPLDAGAGLGRAGEEEVAEADPEGATEPPLPQNWFANDGRLSDDFRSLIEGMSVSVDVSTDEQTAGRRLFGTVCEVMDDPQSKHGVTLLVHDAEPNFQ